MDFEPVGLLSTIASIVARKNLPADNLKEFVDWLRVNPAKASVAGEPAPLQPFQPKEDEPDDEGIQNRNDNHDVLLSRARRLTGQSLRAHSLPLVSFQSICSKWPASIATSSTVSHVRPTARFLSLEVLGDCPST
jgi:hypothetical protein